MGLKATDKAYRFLVLFFNCLLTFGSYFCFDMPSVLQNSFTNQPGCSNDTDSTVSSSLITGPKTVNQSNITDSCCADCLGLSDGQYNLLYAIYAWTNAVVVICAGFLIDKLGNRIGVFLFSLLCVIGSSTFALGATLKNTTAMFPLLLIGRLIFGSGNGSLTIVQNRITAFWFKDKELAMAFGFTLAFSRLGSVPNFLVTQTFEEGYGLTWTLWGGAMLCGIGFISAIIVSFLDVYGVQQLGKDDSMKMESRKLKVSDIRHFSLSFWLLALTIMFFYNGVFPFVADSSEFIHDKYKFSKTTSAYLSGAVYDVSMVLSPFLGGLIDIVGKRGVLAVSCAILTIPVFGLLAFTEVYPLVSTLWLGFTYSFAAASMWPSIPLVVSQATIGTAMGLTTSIQMIGIGLCNLVVGVILGKNDKSVTVDEKLLRWKYVMIFLLGNTLACVATSIALNINDKKRGAGVLNHSRKEKRQQAMERLADETEGSENDPLLPDRSRIN